MLNNIDGLRFASKYNLRRTETIIMCFMIEHPLNGFSTTTISKMIKKPYSSVFNCLDRLEMRSLVKKIVSGKENIWMLNDVQELKNEEKKNE